MWKDLFARYKVKEIQLEGTKCQWLFQVEESPVSDSEPVVPNLPNATTL